MSEQQSKIELDQERANGIAWSFLQAYYPYLNANPADLHRLYSADGILNHGDFENPKNPTVTAFGTEQIRNQLTKSNLKGCKVMVSHADIQPCLTDKVLIMVLGELAIEDSPAYKFVQTFLVVPGSKPSTYDIANDVLKFIPEDDDDVLQPDVEEEELDVVNQEEVADEADEEKDTSSVFSQDLNEKASTPETTNASTSELKDVPESTFSAESNETSKEVKEEVKGPVEETVDTETKDKKSKEVKEESKEIFKEEVKEESKQKPAKPLSWAAKAAQSKKLAAAPAQIKKAAPAKAEAPVTSPSSTSATTAPAAATTTNSKKFNGKPKTPWFTIYVRGFKDPVTEKQIRDEFGSHFGEVKSVSLNNFVALIDFYEEKAQIAALKKQNILVGTNTVEISPKKKKETTSGSGNTAHGNGSINNSNGKDKKRNNGKKRKTEV